MSECFDEHNEHDQKILWRRAQEIADDNREKELCDVECYNDEIISKEN